MNTLGVSGSTIMSDPDKFNELFKYNLSHIEIGEFKSRHDYKLFINLLEDSLKTFGIHAPLFHGNSKYDIIEHVHFSPETAIHHLEKDAKTAAFLGAKYLLVHFPFFRTENEGDTAKIIEKGLQALSRIQKKYGVEIVCEPKLGDMRSPFGIEYLNNFPIETWKKYSLKICVDLGDYVMAAGDDLRAFEYIKKWTDFIRVVHLHNVDYIEANYHWKPMHKDDEADGHHDLVPIVKYLAGLDDVYFVLEHTPHMGYSGEYILQSTEYIRSLIFD